MSLNLCLAQGYFVSEFADTPVLDNESHCVTYRSHHASNFTHPICKKIPRILYTKWHLSNSLNLYFYWLEEYKQILLLYVKIWLATMTTWNGLRAAWLASLTYISTHTRLRPGLIHLAQSNSKQQQLGGIFMRTQNRAHTSLSDTKLFYILKARCGKILYNPEKKTQCTGDVHYLSVNQTHC